MKLYVVFLVACVSVLAVTAGPVQTDQERELELIDQVRELVERGKGGKKGGSKESHESAEDYDHVMEFCKGFWHAVIEGEPDEYDSFHHKAFAEGIGYIIGSYCYLEENARNTGCDYDRSFFEALHGYYENLEKGLDATWPMEYEVTQENLDNAKNSVKTFLDDATARLNTIDAGSSVDDVDATLYSFGDSNYCHLVNIAPLMVQMEIFGVQDAPKCMNMFMTIFMFDCDYATLESRFQAAAVQDIQCVKSDIQALQNSVDLDESSHVEHATALAGISYNSMRISSDFEWMFHSIAEYRKYIAGEGPFYCPEMKREGEAAMFRRQKVALKPLERLQKLINELKDKV